MSDLLIEKNLDSQTEMAKKNQDLIFERFDRGGSKEIINVFEKFRVPVPEDYIDKIALYMARAAELKANGGNISTSTITPIKKDEVVEKPVVYDTPKLNQETIQSVYDDVPMFDINIDYGSINGSFDLVPLPSKGECYPNKCSSLPVSFLTGVDESLLMQANVNNQRDILNLLIKNKVMVPGFDPKTLTAGDKNAILLFLRVNAFGTDFTTPITFQGDETVYSGRFDLRKLKRKEITIKGDENGYFDYSFKNQLTGEDVLIKFKYINAYDSENIVKRVLKDVEDGIGHHKGDLYSIYHSIVSINGVTDRKEIEDYISESMNISDYRKLKKYIMKNEPGIDLTCMCDEAKPFGASKPDDSNGGGVIRDFLATLAFDITLFHDGDGADEMDN